MTPQQTTPTANGDSTTWALEREKAYELFGGATPFDTDDTEIAAVFAQHPSEVIAEIARIADAYANGKVHTPWRALHSRLAKIERDAQPVSLTTDTRLRLAETWIRNAGLYCPTETDCADALFNSGGLLVGQADAYQERMVTLWRHEQPRARQAEQDAQQRAERWKRGQEALAKAKANPVVALATIPEDAGSPDHEETE